TAGGERHLRDQRQPLGAEPPTDAATDSKCPLRLPTVEGKRRRFGFKQARLGQDAKAHRQNSGSAWHYGRFSNGNKGGTKFFRKRLEGCGSPRAPSGRPKTGAGGDSPPNLVGGLALQHQQIFRREGHGDLLALPRRRG